MSLVILVAGVVAGITVIVVAVHLTGGSTTATLAGTEHAKRRFALDFPEETVGTAWLVRNRQTAFLNLGDGRLGIVHGVGSHFLTRIVYPTDLARLDCEGDCLSMRLKDFSWRGGRFEFQDADQAQAVLHALQAKDPVDQWEAA